MEARRRPARSGDNRKQYDAAGATVIGISPDEVKDIDKFATKNDLEFTLVADKDHKVAEKYGTWVEKSMYGKKYMGVQRATFIIRGMKVLEAFPKVQPRSTTTSCSRPSPRSTASAMSSWDKGSYEITAAQLAPVAPIVAYAVEPVSGQPALDLACGTGNEALELACRGAEVTGARRGPQVARSRGRPGWRGRTFRQLDPGGSRRASFRRRQLRNRDLCFRTDLHRLPAGKRRRDRKGPTAPGQDRLHLVGRRGPVQAHLQEMSKAAVATHFGQEPPSGEHAPFEWGDEAAVRELFAGNGVALQVETLELVLEEESAETLNQKWFDHHPIRLDHEGTDR